MLDSAVTLVAEKALKINSKDRLGVKHKLFPIAQLFEEFKGVFMERYSTRQDELRLIANKIKMRRNRLIKYYIKNIGSSETT